MDHTQKHGFSWPLFILMASITFMAILSELMPSGILPEMASGFGITEAQAVVLSDNMLLLVPCLGFLLFQQQWNGIEKTIDAFNDRICHCQYNYWLCIGLLDCSCRPYCRGYLCLVRFGP
ncbi:hypothetical protein QY890_00860 [Latilactobacillus sakei]